MDAMVRGSGGARGASGGAGGGVRLTRRGRAVVVVLLAMLAIVLVVLVARPGQAADPAAPKASVVVRQGDTLWSIAGRHSPGRDPRDTVEEIRRLNGLDGYSLRAGQRLLLPRRR